MNWDSDCRAAFRYRKVVVSLPSPQKRKNSADIKERYLSFGKSLCIRRVECAGTSEAGMAGGGKGNGYRISIPATCISRCEAVAVAFGDALNLEWHKSTGLIKKGVCFYEY